MSSSMFDREFGDGPVAFKLVGLASNVDFQKCQAYIEVLHKKFPAIYEKPYIRPMLEFDWSEYLTKQRRKYGQNFWYLRKPAVIYINGKYLGDDEDLEEFISDRFSVKLYRDYACLAQQGVLDIYEKFIECGRKFVYFVVSINGKVIGHMIFMLYADLLPKTCKNFVRKCKSKRHGYKGTQIHRIMDASWIQFADYTLPLKSKPFENFSVPHNRRGVLSMCNDGRHKNNTTQFFVCLNPTPWMDYRYVAFGQLVQGDRVLAAMERCHTYYEYPSPDMLRIANCGLITLDDTAAAKQVADVQKYIEQRKEKPNRWGDFDVRDPRDSPSTMLARHCEMGHYWFVDDDRTHVEKEKSSISIWEQAEEVDYVPSYVKLFQDYVYAGSVVPTDTRTTFAGGEETAYMYMKSEITTEKTIEIIKETRKIEQKVYDVTEGAQQYLQPEDQIYSEHTTMFEAQERMEVTTVEHEETEVREQNEDEQGEMTAVQEVTVEQEEEVIIQEETFVTEEMVIQEENLIQQVGAQEENEDVAAEEEAREPAKRVSFNQ